MKASIPSPNEARPRLRVLLFSTLALFVLPAALVAAGCGGEERESVPPPERGEALDVRALELAYESAPVLTQATGSVEAMRRVMPGTKILGRVEAIRVREGDAVRAGAELARLESRDLEAAVTQAEAALTMANAQFENARAQYERMVDLRERGSVTEKNLEDALAGFRVAEAGIEEAEANLEAAKVMLTYASVVSPLAGYVTERRIEEGDMASPGMPLFVVEEIDRVKIIVGVPEAEVVGLERGAVARVEIPALGETLDAAVHRVVPSGNRASRTYDVELHLDNADKRLKSGMFARARFPRGERELLFVPESAVVRRGQLEGVYVIEEDESVRLRWVRLGPESEGRFEVLSGLEPGERIVADPPASLRDGGLVSVG